MPGERWLREVRRRRGLTQAQLAERAGVSRQLVGAVEAGRHLPRVDAAVALAGVLGEPVESLFAPGPTDDRAEALGVIAPPADGDLVRVARVGDRLVCHPVAPAGESWAPADGVVRDGRVETLEPSRRGAADRPTAVVAGCDPAIGLAGRLLEGDAGPGIVAVTTSSAAAVAALAGGRAHAVVVHGTAGDLPEPPVPVRRWELARWEVGLAAPADLPAGWVGAALGGRLRVVQREDGAASQQAFVRALTATGAPDPPQGPVAGGHLDAAAWARRDGCAAVSIRPAALALGLDFHALEAHHCELWVAPDHLDLAAVRRFLDELTGPRLSRRLEAIGGYDLTRLGVEVAA